MKGTSGNGPGIDFVSHGGKVRARQAILHVRKRNG
jgi:hypothetical protein